MGQVYLEPVTGGSVAQGEGKDWIQVGVRKVSIAQPLEQKCCVQTTDGT